MLLAVRDEETGEGLTDRELRDQIITFIGAGHETTAVALAWTVYLLSQHPEAETRLSDEVAEVIVQGLERGSHTVWAPRPLRWLSRSCSRSTTSTASRIV